jgi:hypothetical protein
MKKNKKYYIIKEIFPRIFYYIADKTDLATIYSYPQDNEYSVLIPTPPYSIQPFNHPTFKTMNEAQNYIANFLNSHNYYELPDYLKILL